MFGIDLGINLASVSCATQDHKLIDSGILFGRKKKSSSDDWNRIVYMSDLTIDLIRQIIQTNPKVYIDNLVTIEEPVFNYRARNPLSYATLISLYALTRYKLEKRKFKCLTVKPLSVKAIAKRLGFKSPRLSSRLCDPRGNLTKAGMIKAFTKVTGKEPLYHTILGKETLADSFFIAQCGIERLKLQHGGSIE